MPPPEAKTWAANKIKTWTGVTLVTQPPTPMPAMPVMPVTMLAQHQPRPQEPNEETPEDIFGMCKSELANMLKLCGLTDGELNSLPTWFKQVAEKGQNDNTMNLVIMRALQDTIYKEAK
eukprot:7229443-Ditylum_brightwellii.AAC.1